MPHTTPSNTIHISNQISTHYDHKPNESLCISYVSSLTCSSYSNFNIWLLYLGENDHVSSSLNFVHSYYKIKPISLCLPNGSCMLSKYAETVILSPYLYITNVLSTQDFSLNLISSPKLCESLNCLVHFFYKKNVS